MKETATLFDKDSLLPTDNKRPKAKGEEAPKKLARIYLLAGGLFVLLLLSGLGLSYVISLKSAQAAKTPLLGEPALTDDPSMISTPSRSEQYASKIKNRKRNEKKEAIERDRMKRIAMRWEEIYKGEAAVTKDEGGAEKEKLEVAPLDREDKLKEVLFPDGNKIGQRRKPAKKVGRGTSGKRETALEKEDRDTAKQRAKIQAKREAALGKEEFVFNTLEKKTRNVSELPIGRVGGIVDGDQKIRAGQYIKFRLTEALEIPGADILPINTPLMGLCTFGNSRIKAEVGAIYFQGELLPIKLKLYDIDLIEGIAYLDPRIKAQEQREMESAGSGLYDDIFYEIPYAGAFLNAGKNILKNRSREKSRKVLLQNNYRVIFQVYPN